MNDLEHRLTILIDQYGQTAILEALRHIRVRKLADQMVQPEYVFELKEKGLAYEDIARQLGMTVGRARRLYDQECSRRRYEPERRPDDIYWLHLSSRVECSLKRGGIFEIGSLVDAYKDGSVRRFRGMGKMGLADIKEALLAKKLITEEE